MKTQTWLGLLKLGVIVSALQPAMHAAADDEHGGNRGDDEGVRARLQLPSGQYITPTAISGAVQQLLNPGLPAYPNFVAGEAVKSQLSPDGATLAILCAGQNSLFKASERRCRSFRRVYIL